jgi:two-component system response regulator AdeR
MRNRVHGDVLVLRRVEADLLAHLLSAPGRVFTRSQLVKLVCDSDNVLERVIDVHVSRLRMSLANVGAESMIETVRGIGYRLLELPMTDSRPV